MSRQAIRSQSTCPKRSPPEPEGEDIALDIVYEDDDIIVIDKPKGLVVHPAAGHETGTLVNALIAHCGASLSGIGGVRRPGIVHRLDKDTTGLMVVGQERPRASIADRAIRRSRPHRADAARLHGLHLGRAQPPARHGRRADRPASLCPRKDGGARGRPRGGDPLGIAGGLSGARRQAGRLAAGLPARDRADPSDPGAPLPYRPPPDGRCRLWPALQDQGRPARAQGQGCARRPRPAGPARLPACPGTPPNRRTFALGGGLAGGFASPARAPWKRRYDAGLPEKLCYDQ